MLGKSLARAVQVLAISVVLLFCVLSTTDALWVGGNIDVHNNTGQVAHDFHIKGQIKSTTAPVLLIQIGYIVRGGVPVHFPNFWHKITHAGGDLWDFEAEWSSLDVRHCEVGHFGLFFDATCRNVWVDLDGWWTDHAGNLIGHWPILGFEVPTHWWDPPTDQVFRLQGDAGEDGIPLEIVQMDLMLMAPPADDQGAKELFGLLNAEGMDKIGPWAPVPSASDVQLPPGPDSFFDVFVEIDLGRGMEPNQLLLARTLVIWPEEPGGRWFFHVHQAHPPIRPVEFDIKPASCPNPFNPKSKGMVPFAIVGQPGFDGTQVDPMSIVLTGPSGVTLDASHPSYKYRIEDSTEPPPIIPGGDPCYQCFEGYPNVDTDGDGVPDTYGGDGVLDFVFHFDNDAVEPILDLGSYNDGDCIPVLLNASSVGGMPLGGRDWFLLRKKGNKAPSRHDTLSTLWGEIKAR